MPSTNKTPFLFLNQFIASDKPKMADFNQDNQKIDTAVKTHFEDMAAHLSANDRQKLDTPLFTTGSYVGDGNSNRVIDAGFAPSLGFVFAAGGMAVEFSDTGMPQTNIRFGIFCPMGSTFGTQWLENGFKVINVQGATPDGRSIQLNFINQKYTYVLFR